MLPTFLQDTVSKIVRLSFLSLLGDNIWHAKGLPSFLSI